MRSTIIAIIAVFLICGLDAYDPFPAAKQHGKNQDHHREMQIRMDRMDQHMREMHGLERQPYRVPPLGDAYPPSKY